MQILETSKECSGVTRKVYGPHGERETGDPRVVIAPVELK